MVDGIEGVEEGIVCHCHYLGVVDTIVVLWKIWERLVTCAGDKFERSFGPWRMRGETHWTMVLWEKILAKGIRSKLRLEGRKVTHPGHGMLNSFVLILV